MKDTLLRLCLTVTAVDTINTAGNKTNTNKYIQNKCITKQRYKYLCMKQIKENIKSNGSKSARTGKNTDKYQAVHIFSFWFANRQIFLHLR